MKKLSFVVIIVFSFVLAGCNDIIDAISGINSKANEAAKAISEDVHTLRSIPIEMDARQTITINDFIKAILRDVQWKHEKKDQLEVLIVDGSWKDGLFDDYEFTNEEKEILKDTGEVVIQLFFDDKQLLVDLTTVVLTIEDKIIVNLTGQEAFSSLQKDFK
jgi:predicted small secreted protein